MTILEDVCFEFLSPSLLDATYFMSWCIWTHLRLLYNYVWPRYIYNKYLFIKVLKNSNLSIFFQSGASCYVLSFSKVLNKCCCIFVVQKSLFPHSVTQQKWGRKLQMVTRLLVDPALAVKPNWCYYFPGLAIFIF